MAMTQKSLKCEAVIGSNAFWPAGLQELAGGFQLDCDAAGGSQWRDPRFKRPRRDEFLRAVLSSSQMVGARCGLILANKQTVYGPDYNPELFPINSLVFQLR